MDFPIFQNDRRNSGMQGEPKKHVFLAPVTPHVSGAIDSLHAIATGGIAASLRLSKRKNS
jgi:hypothetical protein